MPCFFMSATALGWFSSTSTVSLVFQYKGLENPYITPSDTVNEK